MGRDVKLGLLQDILDYCGATAETPDRSNDSADHYWAASLKLEMYEFGRLCESIERDRLADAEGEKRPLRRAR
jgi:hypothetical protein